MKIPFEFATYNEENDNFELDEKLYDFELDEDQATTYNMLKDNDMVLYNYFAASQLFKNWIIENIYPQKIGKKIVITSIDQKFYHRFFFFKITSGDTHYDYFKKFFKIIEESDWQDRDYIGKVILEHLKVKKLDLLIELKNEEQIDESKD